MVKNGRSERVPIVARSPPLFSLWRLTQAHPRAAAILVNELDAKPLIRNFSGSDWLRKNLPEINDGLQNRLKWSTGALGLHPLPSI
jgi:hypothetical protein